MNEPNPTVYCSCDCGEITGNPCKWVGKQVDTERVYIEVRVWRLKSDTKPYIKLSDEVVSRLCAETLCPVEADNEERDTNAALS